MRVSGMTRVLLIDDSEIILEANAMMLEGHGLTIGYPDRIVGVGLDVKLAKGEVLALLGYEIVEGSLKDGRILETRRINYSPQRTQVTRN